MDEGIARRLAWMGFLLITGLYSVGVAFAVQHRAGAAAASSWGSSGGVVGPVLFILSLFSFPVVGILILSRHPKNPIGWICLAIGLTWGFDGVLSNYAGNSLGTDPSRTALAAALDSWLWIPAIGLMGTFLILLFPNGHLLSPRWKKLAWLSAITMVLASVAVVLRPGSLANDGYPGLINPLGVRSLNWLLIPLQWLLILIPLSIVASLVSLILRFRRARGTDRLQLKWLTGGAAAVALIYLVAMIASLGFGTGNSANSPTWVQLVEDAALFSFALIPTAIGIAILKHRLYDINIVIHKTLVFGALAAFITAAYVAVVVGIGSVIGQGTEPNLALSVAATAIIAIAFQPVRERVQRLASRLVYGKRATPYEVLSRFAQTIASSYGTEELLPRTVETLREATGATSSCVWLVAQDRLVPAATSPPAQHHELKERELISDQIARVPDERSALILDRGELLGVLTIIKPEDTIVPSDQELLDNLASQTGQIVRNARLTSDLQARVGQLAVQSRELRESRQRIVVAQDTERRTLERNIHDGAQQHLVALAVKLKLTKTLIDRAPERATAMLSQLRGELGETVTALRDLASGVYPVALEQDGIAAALKVQTQSSALPIDIDSNVSDRYPLDIEATIYFCCLEALQNVGKYAGASHARVVLRDEGGTLSFLVMDDGHGFDPQMVEFGSGLRNMADRVAAARGVLDISSSTQGQGTTITGHIPARQLEMTP